MRRQRRSRGRTRRVFLHFIVPLLPFTRRPSTCELTRRPFREGPAARRDARSLRTRTHPRKSDRGSGGMHEVGYLGVLSSTSNFWLDGARMGSTVTASYLFCDLAGSTAFAARVGDSRADELRRAQYLALRDAVGASDGDEVKSTGDGLMVVFTSAVNALRCAVLMQRGIHKYNERSGQPIALRVGVGIGESEFDGSDYYGLAVVEAARLSAAAQPEQILVGDLVRTMVGTRGTISGTTPATGEQFQFVALPPMQLKGLPTVTPAFELQWQQRTRSPLPTAFASAHASVFVGRTAELHAVVNAAQQAAKGDGGLLVVQGEPGIGKTRLLGEVARKLHADGGVVLYGRCSEEPLVAFEPFVAALRGHAAACDDAALQDHVRYGTAPLLRLLPEIARPRAQRRRRSPDRPAVGTIRALRGHRPVARLVGRCGRNDRARRHPLGRPRNRSAHWLPGPPSWRTATAHRRDVSPDGCRP